MRPQSIVHFERLVLLILALSLAVTALNWDFALAMASRQGFGSGFLITVTVIVIAINLLLLWLIARRRSVVAMWIYVGLSVLGLVLALPSAGQLMRMSMLLFVVQLIQWLLTLVSIWLLFRPDSRTWFRKDATPAA